MKCNSGEFLVIVVLCGFGLLFIECIDDPGQVKGNNDEIPKGTHVIQDKARGSGTISMGTPDLSDEDSQADHMPTYLKCDACRIISMHLFNSLHNAIHKYKSGPRELGEDLVIELTEAVCDDKWDAHGIKEVDGVKRLSGPGFETADIPGVMQGGGRWPFRFKQMCSQILGDFGEDNIYQIVTTKGKQDLENYLCRGDGSTGSRGVCYKGKGKGKRNKNNKSEKKEL